MPLKKYKKYTTSLSVESLPLFTQKEGLHFFADESPLQIIRMCVYVVVDCQWGLL
jgi:hypothetical protein